MASADLTRLMTDARIALPGALDDAIKHELFSVMGDFFEGSNCWREEVSFKTRAGQVEYDVTPTGTASVVRLLSLKNSAGVVVRATMYEPGTLVLAYEPSQVETLTAVISLTVKDPTNSEDFPIFPAWVLAKYRAQILDGVKGRMMAQPNKPYTNERLSVYYLRLFRNGISKAKVEANHANLQNAQAWAYPQNFATGRS